LDHPFQGAEVKHQSLTPGCISINRFDALSFELAEAIKNQIE
jgi:hypothetical protein|tara:strand:- start:666 stop:791 length:126 start_codon:yes stop_codon:yes gene_type:complete